MSAQVSGILLVAVFGLAAVVGIVLACRLVALSAPSVRRPAGGRAGRGPAAAVPAPAVSEPAPSEPGGTLG